MASSRLFKEILNTKWGLSTLRMVIILFSCITITKLTIIIGVGALAALLSATYFAQSTYWSFHFIVSLSFAVWNLVILAGVFRFQTQDGGPILKI